jgi:hypothetical protein
MAEILIKQENLPARCEICHKNDYFDPVENYCLRCKNIIEESKIQLQKNINTPIRFPTLMELRNEQPNFINRLIISVKDFPQELKAQAKHFFNELLSINTSNIINYFLSYNYKIKLLIPLYLFCSVLKFFIGFIAIVFGLILLLSLQFGYPDPKIYIYFCLFEVFTILLFIVFNWAAKFSWKYWLDNS